MKGPSDYTKASYFNILQAELEREAEENKEVLELLKTAIAKAGYTGKVAISSDDVKALCS
ncbi:hypothetical protein NC653_029874 [Populus alba x Populus x berolinensis]|uniref:Uncharacterized protein n=1 Tax=Populus alba x Populus x berolinensis TaxID=444605 RepID=A0AAD6M3M2_9ROSI|nr:hypothetical protein NC653_029874 [Populus alba x Populus x berolinensis]